MLLMTSQEVEEYRKKLHRFYDMRLICSKKHKKKLSLRLKGRKLTEETKQKIGLAMKGKIRSKKHSKNISLALKGRKRPPFSEEWKKNMSLNNAHFWLGKKRPLFSKETRKKMSLAKKGKKFSNKHRKNISIALSKRIKIIHT